MNARDPINDPTGRRWYRRRRAIAEQSMRYGAHPDTAWAKADTVFTADGYWQKRCVVCDAPFEARRSDAVYCSARCRAARSRTQKQRTTPNSDYL